MDGASFHLRAAFMTNHYADTLEACGLRYNDTSVNLVIMNNIECLFDIVSLVWWEMFHRNVN